MVDTYDIILIRLAGCGLKVRQKRACQSCPVKTYMTHAIASFLYIPYWKLLRGFENQHFFEDFLAIMQIAMQEGFQLCYSGGSRILKGGFRCPERFLLRSCARTRPATHARKTTKRGVPRNPRNPLDQPLLSLFQEPMSPSSASLPVVHVDPVTGLLPSVPRDFQIFINLVDLCR